MLSEARRGERKIGTTSRGIGPAYEDKIGRRGIRVCDLLATATALAQEVRENVTRAQPDHQGHRRSTGSRCSTSCVGLRRAAAAVGRRRVAVSRNAARATAERVMFEGAQATLLDIDHGTYPFVTSSNASIGGVCTGLGVPPRAIDGVLGVAKAYTTRVGEGPLPTELSGELAERLRESGQEYGASTGRPRRCGWHDAVVVRYSARINGLDALALTKLDVLDGLPEVRICTGYRTSKGVLTEFPADLRALASAEPVYETLPGWTRADARRDAVRRAAARSAALHQAARRGERRAVRDHFNGFRSQRKRSSATTRSSRTGSLDSLRRADPTISFCVAELLDRVRLGIEELDAGAVAGSGLAQARTRPTRRRR